jgi:uncharacterized RDD family membrane protein YckC
MSQGTDKEVHVEHKEISIETLSTPPLHIEPAPLSRRAIAGLLDSLIIGFSAIPAFALQGSVYSAITASYIAIVWFLYYFLLEGVFSTTIGKSLLKLRVLGTDGDPCSWSSSFKRNLLRLLDWLPFLYVIGWISVLASRDRKRVGDRVAATIVTMAPQKDINPPPAPFLFH